MKARSDKGEDIIITKEEKRSVYLHPGLLVLEASMEKQNGVKTTLEIARISNTKAQQHYKVNIDVNEGNVGSGILNISYQTETAEENVAVDLSDASLNIKEPVFTPQGFANGEEIKIREGAQPADMKVTLNARAGIKSCELTIASPYLQPILQSIGAPQTIDLASNEEPHATAKKLLFEKGLRVIGLGDNIERLALIDFTNLVRNIQCVNNEEETSTFTLRATDIGSRKEEKELVFSTKMESNLFAFPEITDKVLIDNTEAIATVNFLAAEGSENGKIDAQNVQFKYSISEDNEEWIGELTTEWIEDIAGPTDIEYASRDYPIYIHLYSYEQNTEVKYPSHKNWIIIYQNLY